MDLILIKYSRKIAPKLASAFRLLGDHILVVFVWIGDVRLIFLYECDTASLAPFAPQRELFWIFSQQIWADFWRQLNSLCPFTSWGFFVWFYFGSINYLNFLKLRLTCNFNDGSLGISYVSIFLLQPNFTGKSSKLSKTHHHLKKSSRNS